MADPMLASRNSKRVSSRHKRVFSIWTLVVWSDQHREGRVSILSPLTILRQDGERQALRYGVPLGERKTKGKTGKQGKTRQKQPQKLGYF